MKKDIINKIGNWLEKVALERAYIERNGCPFAIGEDKLPAINEQVRDFA